MTIKATVAKLNEKIAANIKLEYPANSTAIVYHRMDGRPAPLEQMIEHELEWIASRWRFMDSLLRECLQSNIALIAHTESQDARIEALEAECARLSQDRPLPQEVEARLLRMSMPSSTAIEDYPKEDVLLLSEVRTFLATPATAPLMGEGAKSQERKCVCKVFQSYKHVICDQPYNDNGGRETYCQNPVIGGRCSHDKACHQGAHNDQ